MRAIASFSKTLISCAASALRRASDQATQRNVLLVQQSSAAAEAMRLATERMAALMARFRLETGEGTGEGELVIDMSR